MPPRSLVRRLGRFSAAVAALAAAPGTALGQDPDWPCIQRLVPEVSAAMIWAGPPIDDAGAWADDPAIRDLAAELAARRTPLEEAARMIEEFAASLDPEARDERLTMLFAGVLDTINRERASIIAGIERFARRQRALSDAIEQTGAALRGLQGNGTAEQRARRQELEERRAWDTRIFDEREDSLTYLCEQPVLLEQRAFALAREIAAHLG